ncbi:hypothetical protein [Pedobacter agri]|uniref:hypothetical protein n=1 Tax=Pedobacter agri TaxID=454586 RepID=UPI00292E218A|nr:hypothetical protein [Pedobacter agri]
MQKNVHNSNFEELDKLDHEIKGSLGVVKMLVDELAKELTPSEYSIRLIEIIISIWKETWICTEIVLLSKKL